MSDADLGKSIRAYEDALLCDGGRLLYEGVVLSLNAGRVVGEGLDRCL
jgi:hypothetical protein